MIFDGSLGIVNTLVDLPPIDHCDWRAKWPAGSWNWWFLLSLSLSLALALALSPSLPVLCERVSVSVLLLVKIHPSMVLSSLGCALVWHSNWVSASALDEWLNPFLDLSFTGCFVYGVTSEKERAREREREREELFLQLVTQPEWNRFSCHAQPALSLELLWLLDFLSNFAPSKTKGEDSRRAGGSTQQVNEWMNCCPIHSFLTTTTTTRREKEILLLLCTSSARH